MKTAATIVFSGSLQTERFVEFIAHRAWRLDLSARVGDAGPQRVSVAVAGEADLVDAFEMACSLGPPDCLVLDVVRTDVIPARRPGDPR